jgi:hypothetical protein
MMLITATTLEQYPLHSLDGDIGKPKEFYFDDTHWTIRYLIANTSNWLTGRQVLLSPYAVTAVHSAEQFIAINLTKKQIEDSPSITTDKPVSRQFEEDYYGYYGWPMYWGGAYMWGGYPTIERDRTQWRTSTQEEKTWDAHLRSTQDVHGYNIQAEDGEIGHIADFLIDSDTWAIRYLVVATHNWWPGKKILIAPQWIERISWAESKVFVNLLRETIQQAPEYTDTALLTRDAETTLHEYYQRQGYWVAGPTSKESAHTA